MFFVFFYRIDETDETISMASATTAPYVTALVISVGNVEIHVVESKSDGEYQLIYWSEPIFLVGEKTKLYPAELEDFATMTFIEFVKEHPDFEYTKY